ncbi:glycosyltransferase [Micromonospora sp. HM5-17]|jgi:glycosyltransferase involved in cell wall biosynthesis|uniref:glycosyltransferase n=1 Tax=Micromonospora sp. HM5-17 TaxID=2487710 RepID=UPI000F4A247A|nr:glycosyltransferase [Micromonospora sp. HM5-17]ROT33185.1 glycosyltransferase [Micromonospora sp. HM5-17]
MAGLRVCVLLKTNSGGLWIIPQVEELRRRGHGVTVVLPPGPGRLTTELTRRGIEVVESPFDFRFRPGPGTVRGLWRLRRLLRQLRPDVLNYHLYASALAARLASVGMLVGRAHMVAGPLYLESPVIRPVERLLWRMDDVTISCTRHISQLYGKLGCPAERRPVIQYGIDTEYFAPSWAAVEPTRRAAVHAEARAKARAEIGIDERDFLVVMVGYVYPPKRLAHNGRGIKGHDTLLAAWQTFHARHPRTHLLLVGEGFTDAGKRYRAELVQRFGVDADPSVTWLGWVPDLRPYFTAADLSVTPSLSEGSNGVVREASAMGVPSIVSDAGGLPEAVDERQGWVVPRGDVAALAAALEAAYREFGTGQLRHRGEYARQRAVGLFDRGPAAAEVADVIERLGAGAAERRRRGVES